jgi:hypothetical protein
MAVVMRNYDSECASSLKTYMSAIVENPNSCPWGDPTPDYDVAAFDWTLCHEPMDRRTGDAFRENERV